MPPVLMLEILKILSGFGSMVPPMLSEVRDDLVGVLTLVNIITGGLCPDRHHQPEKTMPVDIHGSSHLVPQQVLLMWEKSKEMILFAYFHPDPGIVWTVLVEVEIFETEVLAWL